LRAFIITHANGANLLESNMLQTLDKISLLNIENQGISLYGENIVEVNRLPLTAVVILNPSTSADSSSLSNTLLTVFKVEAISGYVLGFVVLLFYGYVVIKRNRKRQDENIVMSQSSHELLPDNDEEDT
jgi:hypothetical protein